MLVVRDNFAINLDNCTDFYCDPDTNKIIFCMNMLAEQGNCSYWNDLQYSTRKEMVDDFNKIVWFYSEREKVCLL